MMVVVMVMLGGVGWAEEVLLFRLRDGLVGGCDEKWDLQE